MVWLEQHTDERAASLPYLDSPAVPIAYLGAYIASIYFGKRYMENRKAYDLKLIIGAYNLLQVVLCVKILQYAFNGGFSPEYVYKCVVPESGRSPAAMSMVHGSYATWLLKGLELVETIFFVLRKKDNQVSVLHVYHHISTFVLTWFFARSVAGGMLSFSVVLNSLVHILMYSYYFLSLFGPDMQRRLSWFKRCITTVQIVQFLVLLVNGTIAGLPGCQSPKPFLVPYMMNLLFLLFMFVRFYASSYNNRRQSVAVGKQSRD